MKTLKTFEFVVKFTVKSSDTTFEETTQALVNDLNCLGYQYELQIASEETQ